MTGLHKKEITAKSERAASTPTCDLGTLNTVSLCHSNSTKQHVEQTRHNIVGQYRRAPSPAQEHGVRIFYLHRPKKPPIQTRTSTLLALLSCICLICRRTWHTACVTEKQGAKPAVPSPTRNPSAPNVMQKSPAFKPFTIVAATWSSAGGDKSPKKDVATGS